MRPGYFSEPARIRDMGYIPQRRTHTTTLQRFHPPNEAAFQPFQRFNVCVPRVNINELRSYQSFIPPNVSTFPTKLCFNPTNVCVPRVIIRWLEFKFVDTFMFVYGCLGGVCVGG